MTASITITLPKNTKTYSTIGRAAKFGYCRDAAPIDTPNGQRWVAKRFWNRDGSINLYKIA